MNQQTPAVPNPGLVEDVLALLLAEEEATRRARELGLPLGPGTGFPSLDREVGGYLSPGLHVMLSAPGAGKTAFALQVAARCGFPCLYVSAEMRPVELVRRIVARETRTCLKDLRDGSLPGEELKQKGAAAARACPMLALYDGADVNAAAIQEAAVALRERFEAAHLLIALDSLTDWAAGGAGGVSEEYAVTEAALTALKNVSGRLSCPILVIAHRNRAGQRGEDAMKLFSGKATGRIEYIAESLWNLEREGSEPDLSGLLPVRLNILKNRHGVSGRTLRFTFEGRLMEFKEEGI